MDFGVRGKSAEQVKAEIGRLNKFLDMSTSTVKGAKNYFRNVASNLGIVEYKDMPDLQNKINNFFEISGKVKEYLHNSKEIGVAIGYQKIWEIVSDYVQEVGSDMRDVEQTVKEITEKIVPAIGHGYVADTLDSFLDGF